MDQTPSPTPPSTDSTNTPTIWVYDDGGRADAGYKGITGDCGVRAIAIACEIPYQEVYDLITKAGKRERMTAKRRRSGRSSPRGGIWRETFHRIMADFGWGWTPTMQIGQGCKVHLAGKELPGGRIICSCSKHYVAVIDGIVHDTHDCTRGGTRCVYGYWFKP